MCEHAAQYKFILEDLESAEVLGLNRSWGEHAKAQLPNYFVTLINSRAIAGATSAFGREKKNLLSLSGIRVAGTEKQHLQVCRWQIHTAEADT